MNRLIAAWLIAVMPLQALGDTVASSCAAALAFEENGHLPGNDV